MSKFRRSVYYFIGFTLFHVCAMASDTAKSLAKLPERYQRMFESSGGMKFKISPNQKFIILAEKKSYKSYEQVINADYFKAVGKALNSRFAIDEDTLEYSQLILIDLITGQQTNISQPDASFVDINWSPNSKQFALVVKKNNQLSLWRYQLDSHKLLHWSDIPISAQLSAKTLVWLPNSEAVVVRQSLLVSPLKNNNKPYSAITKNTAKVVASRVYRDLLDTPDRQQQFKKLLKQKAVLVTDNIERELTSPSMLESLSVSPNGDYLLTIQLDENINSTVKLSRLARRYQVIALKTGKVVATPTNLRAATNVAKVKDAAAKGARSLQWMPNKPATLTWAEALSQSGIDDSNLDVDSIKQWSAPFIQEPQIITKTNWRIFDAFWTKKGRLVFIDWKYSTKEIRVWSQTEQGEKQLLEQYNYKNKYLDPGDIDTETTPLGIRLATSNQANDVYFFGRGQTRENQRPFISKYSTNGEKTTVFQSSKNQLTQPLYVLNEAEKKGLIVISESNSKPKMLNFLDQQQNVTTLFDWETLSLSYVKSTPINLKFEREDGLQISGDLYLPDSFNKEKVPVVVWIYPRETTYEKGQQRTAAQQKYTAIYPQSPLTSLLEGIAVLDMSNFPIVKYDNSEANDTFIDQQISNSKAMIAALEKTGKIDTSKILLMGHSYGAFSALSLLAHSNLFTAGIVRSGAYNRTLTPLGFQREKRTMWEAPELYQKLSPIFQADQIKEPVLLIHGVSDQNPGTSYLQSEMMFQALQANGGKARLLLLPEEGHSYRIRENLKIMLKHQADWINLYLLN